MVAEDCNSIVLWCYADSMRKKFAGLSEESSDLFLDPELQHIHFEVLRGRQYYWVGLGRLCEWFKLLK